MQGSISAPKDLAFVKKLFRTRNIATVVHVQHHHGRIQCVSLKCIYKSSLLDSERNRGCCRCVGTTQSCTYALVENFAWFLLCRFLCRFWWYVCRRQNDRRIDVLDCFDIDHDVRWGIVHRQSHVLLHSTFAWSMHNFTGIGLNCLICLTNSCLTTFSYVTGFPTVFPAVVVFSCR